MDEAAEQGETRGWRTAPVAVRKTAIISKLRQFSVPGYFPQMDPSEHAHAAHRHHEGNESRQTVKDPVCHMDVTRRPPPARSSITASTYYFCSKHCVRKFQADPDRFTAKPKLRDDRVLSDAHRDPTARGSLAGSGAADSA